MVPWWVPIVVALIGFAAIVYQQRRQDRNMRQAARDALTGDQLDFVHKEREGLIEGFADIADTYRRQVDEAEVRMRRAAVDCEKRINLMLRELTDAKTELQKALERIVEMEERHGAE